MITTEQFLLELRSQDVKLWLDGERLRCAAPKGTIDSTLQSELTRRKPEIIKLLQLARGSDNASAPPVCRVPRNGPMPLSFGQERLWFLHQLDPESPVYNIPCNHVMNGPVNEAQLKRALDEVIRRHEILRTTFPVIDGRPAQLIAPAFELTFPVIDLREVPRPSLLKEVQRRGNEELQRPFDLARGPLIRSALLRLPADLYYLMITMHHTVTDGWSLALLAQELETIYQAFVSGRPSSLPEPELQYVDYACWQREWLQGEVLDHLLAYWRKRLGGHLPILELPTDRPRPPVQTFNGNTQVFSFPKSLHDSLKTLGTAEGATIFMTVLAAFKVFLFRYTGQEDMLVGASNGNRNRVELEKMLGFFVNTQVLRTDLSGDPTFRELLARVRKVTLEAYAHQDLPFEKLVEELQPTRDLSHTPLFQVMFTIQNTPLEFYARESVAADKIVVEQGASKFDFSLFVIETGHGLDGNVEYNTDLFDDGTIIRMVQHFRRLLEAVVAHPEQHISELAILPEAERRQIVLEWNQTRQDFPTGRCIPELFQRQLEGTPDAIAVICGTKELTYRQLNERANRLAHHLQKLGVTSESLVGVCLDRSIDLVVCLLSILKAGGAYVPLDPNYPEGRLAFILEDAEATVLLTRQELLGRLPMPRPRVVCIDTDSEAFAGESAATPPLRVSPENLAYVIYTSGSTGRPKGVAVTHRSVATFIHWADALFGAEDLAGVLASTSICFDLSVFEIFVTLCHGGKVIVVENALQLSAVPHTHPVTLINTVPSAITELLNEKAVPPSVRIVNLAGEPLQTPLVRRIYGETNAQKVFDLYGPSEDTTYSTMALRNADGPATIGRPIANTQVYIVSPQLEPAPIGVSGELCLSGEGLARGYHGQPGLTAEKFIADPFSSEPGSRLYRTGDLARYLPSGEIEFIGRRDHQVKIRGFRIELGEIESVLMEHPAIQEAAVVVKEEAPGDKRLVGFLVPRQSPAPSVRELRAFLSRRLPEYMVPSAYVFLASFPLTPNGKLDRKALPMPSGIRPELESAYLPPETGTEQALATIWKELLKVDQVGVGDNFFELGGHSLLATQVVSRVRKIFGVELAVRVVFEKPTLGELARSVEEARNRGAELSAPPVTRVSREGELPLSFAQQRLWFLDRLGQAPYNMAAALRLEGELDVPALERALNELVRRHEALRTRFGERGGQPWQVIDSELKLVLTVEDWTHSAPEEHQARARTLATAEAARRFDLQRGPLVRVSLTRLEAREHLLLLTLHHIIADGWSLGIVVRELGALYGAYTAGEASPLPEPGLQYADYAVWQRGWLRGAVLEEQLNYWRAQLAGAPPLLGLPTDRPRPALEQHRGGVTPVQLSAELRAGLNGLSQRAGVTLFMALVAGFQALLARYSGQRDIVVGSPIANRNFQELEGVVGFFVNTLALRTDLRGDPSFRELLGRVRTVALGAYAHQDLPFEKLVEELRPRRELSHHPIFQVMLALQNAPGAALELRGLRFRGQELEHGSAKFDLSLLLAEGPAGVVGSLEYNADLFEAATMARLAGHFERLLASAVAEPDRRLSHLEWLSQAERHQLLEGWNQTQMDYPRERCLSELFAEATAQQPEAVALVFGAGRLTYGQLNAQADALADHLRALGVGPDVLVGLCLTRSLEMVVGLLGILKAGGAYVPLDPAYPRERLAFMLEDTRAPVLLTQRQLVASLPPHQAQVICLDEPLPPPSVRSALPALTPRHLAYVIYTSGSTGRPKGVALEQRSAVAFIHWAQQVFSPGELAGVLASTSICFDLSVFELLAPLCCGGKVVLVENVLHLASLPADAGVTLINTVPSAMAELLKAEAVPDSVRVVNLAGEPLTVGLVQQIYQQTKAEKVYDLYGPSESTTYSTFALRRSEGPYTIGRPIANTQVYILDEQLQPAPIGVAGELYIGGEGLARGYLNRPDLTAEKFVPHPFSGQAGARVYRTGDLCRYLPGGTLEFLGRRDQQVKVRGFRIELGEIETILAQHPAVRECVVAAREDQGEKRLAGYVVGREGLTPVAAALRSFLKARLPDYMVPSAWAFLEQLPLSPNGKVDRRALPSPEPTGVAQAFVAPQNEIEEIIARIWAECLRVKQVGREDNFFDLGGHSLLLVQVHSRLQEALQRELSMVELFQFPTVEALARQLSQTAQAVSFDAVQERAQQQKQAIGRRRRLDLTIEKEGLE